MKLEASDERVPPVRDEGYFCSPTFLPKQGKNGSHSEKYLL